MLHQAYLKNTSCSSHQPTYADLNILIGDVEGLFFSEKDNF